MKLAVNIDHVASIRQVRPTSQEPDPVYGAVLAELSGADAITVHLRQDRRHIQERDLKLLRTIVKTRLNLDMASSMEMVKVALRIKPDMCTLVPESSEELTLAGGMDVQMFADKIEEVAGNLKAAGIAVSVFVDPDVEQIKALHRLGIKIIELNTWSYTENWNNSFSVIELEKLRKAANYAKKLNFTVRAGHGLTYQNVPPIVSIDDIEELNVGHSIISNSVFMGMGEAVKRMKQLISRKS